MSQSSKEWRRYMAENVSSSESPTGSSLSRGQNQEYPRLMKNIPETHDQSKNHNLHTTHAQNLMEKRGRNHSAYDSVDGSDLSLGLRNSHLLSSPSGPPPVLKPHTLKKQDSHPESHLHETRPDSLIQTDHTESSESVEISLPYYNISNYSQSVNTFSMLARIESRSHYSQRSRPSCASSARSGSAKSLPQSLKHSSLNQVPPQFSQFISDQNTLHPRSPANHSSSADPWDRTEGHQNNGHNTGENGNETKPNSSRTKKNPRNRDISNSMDSQATIFSTKPEEIWGTEGSRWAGRSLRRGKSLRRRLTSRRRVSSRKNESSENPQSSQDTASSLKRAKAVRYTGKTRQIRMYMRQLYYRLKKRLAAVFTFSAGPKRATSTVKMQRSKTLVRKNRANPQNPLVRRNLALISGPLENPTFTGAQRVDHLTDDLKRSAGAEVNPQISDLCNEQLGKYNHLSNYLQEQRQLSQTVANPSSALLSEASSAPPPPPHGHAFKHKTPREISQAFPSCDPALMQETPASVAERQQFQNTWKSYLSNVVSQRIRLRQEIFLFQTILANQPVPDHFARRSDDIVSDILSRHSTLGNERPVPKQARFSSSGSLEKSMPRLPSAVPIKAESEFDNSDQTIDSTAYLPSIDSSEMKSISSRSDDDNVSEFQKVLNRRSMLGDMLSYDSDEFDSEDTLDMTETDTNTTSSHSMYSSSNAAASNSVLVDAQKTVVERYGTVCRRPAMPRRRNTDKSSVYSSSIQDSTYLITRSPGISNNLCGKT